MNIYLDKIFIRIIKSIFIILLIFGSVKTSILYGQDKLATPTIIDSLPKIPDSWEQFSLSIGAFLTNYNSGISFGSEQVGLGIHINIEDALGLKTSTIGFRANVNYRFGKNRRHAFSFGYFGIYRNSHKVLEKELEVGKVTLPVGAEIKSDFDLTILRVKYDYSFLHNNYVSIGVSFGLFILPISFSIKTLNFEDQAEDFIAPLPVFGLRSDFVIAKNLYLHQSIELLLFSIENVQGRILDIDISLEHRTFKNVSFGMGINSNRLNISAKGKDYSNIDFFGKLEMEYTGIYLFAKYRF